MRHWTYEELTASVPRDFEYGREQGRSVYMSLDMIMDGDESDLVEFFIRHTFCIQMFAEKIGFVCKESVEIFLASMDKNLELAKEDLSGDEFRSLEQEVEKAIQAASQVPHRDRKWVIENMFPQEEYPGLRKKSL